ncbi:ribonuclease domain-containing protein [Pseudonocardia sp. TRM90224]|uniref:ribonuclease domain-containing protein n=1 Tax=Pseudonocardia sp. TRM90224 TaxID=2812678 RepID=UPI001E4EB087|nr:ribonuclease domain-containing protein [Pseudonocardia sp. TRM90224]
MTRRTWSLLAGLVLVVAVIGVAFLVRPAGPVPAGADPAAARTAVQGTAQAPAGCGPVAPDVPGAAESGLPVQPLCALPPEAAQVWKQIVAGGPFRYDRDGITFRNRERLLPRKPDGFYREYTVPTPGESDRGARRLVTGKDREVYYTADHYESFVVVDVTATR